MADIAEMAATQRQAIYDDIQGLSDAQWATMTICEPWTVRHLVAHLTGLGNQSVPHFMLNMVRTGFSFDKSMARDVETYNVGSTADMLAAFEKTLSRMKPTPGPKYVSLGEYTVHGEDIRRALRKRGDHDPEILALLADMYKDAGNPIGAKKRLEGLKLTATDADWTIGSGPEVSGPGIDLILAMTGRRTGLDSLSGDGLDTLKSRM